MVNIIFHKPRLHSSISTVLQYLRYLIIQLFKYNDIKN